MRQITSTQNPAIRAFAELEQPSYRRETGLFRVEGEKMVEEALAYGEPVCLLADTARQERFAPLLSVGEARGLDVLLAPAHVLAKAGSAVTPQGILATVRQMPPPASLGDRVVVLDGLQDPGNVGTILRTAEAAGATGCLLCADCCDMYNPKALRATMGSIFRMPLLRMADAAPLLAEWREAGFALLGSLLSGAPFMEAVPGLRPPWALMIGSEARGLSPTLAALATHRLALPMAGHAESLNAAVAAGIMLYLLGLHTA